jgi:hypothetical protein
VRSEDKTPAKTQTEPYAKPLPDSEARPLRKPPDERQDRSLPELKADPVIGFVIRTVVRNVAGTVRKNVKDNVQNAVLETVTDYVSRNFPKFHDKALVRSIETEVGDNVAEFEDESEPVFVGRFITEFVVRSVAGMSSIIDLTQTDARLSSMPVETQSMLVLVMTLDVGSVRISPA